MAREILVLATFALMALAEPPAPQSQYGAPSYSSGGYSSGGYASGGYSSGGYSTGGYSSGYSSGSSSGYPGGSSQFGSFGSGFGNGQYSRRDEPMFTHEQDFQQSPGVIWGKWSVVLPDGRTQRVEYDADESGFHPVVTYEDPRDGGFGGGYSGSRNGAYNY